MLHLNPTPFRILETTRSEYFNWHCLILINFHPSLRSRLLTDRSLFRFPPIFVRQNARFCLGRRKHLGHPCQKQPSTKTATFFFRNEKSGRPGIGRCLRQPLIPAFRSSMASLIYVFWFPLSRIRDMTSERFFLTRCRPLNHSLALA